MTDTGEINFIHRQNIKPDTQKGNKGLEEDEMVFILIPVQMNCASCKNIKSGFPALQFHQ
jgi:hypothetical protein